MHFSAAGGVEVSRLIFDALETGGASLSLCGDTGFNNDGVTPAMLIARTSSRRSLGAGCSTGDCDPINFNHDAVSPDSADIEAILRTIASGSCP